MYKIRGLIPKSIGMLIGIEKKSFDKALEMSSSDFLSLIKGVPVSPCLVDKNEFAFLFLLGEAIIKDYVDEFLKLINRENYIFSLISLYDDGIIINEYGNLNLRKNNFFNYQLEIFTKDTNQSIVSCEKNDTNKMMQTLMAVETVKNNVLDDSAINAFNTSNSSAFRKDIGDKVYYGATGIGSDANSWYLQRSQGKTFGSLCLDIKGIEIKKDYSHSEGCLWDRNLIPHLHIYYKCEQNIENMFTVQF